MSTIILIVLNKRQFFEFLERNYDKEFSKEEIINHFSDSITDEYNVDKLLSELEVEFTYTRSSVIVSCKAGTVYYKLVK